MKRTLLMIVLGLAAASAAPPMAHAADCNWDGLNDFCRDWQCSCGETITVETLFTAAAIAYTEYTTGAYPYKQTTDYLRTLLPDEVNLEPLALLNMIRNNDVFENGGLDIKGGVHTGTRCKHCPLKDGPFGIRLPCIDYPNEHKFCIATRPKSGNGRRDGFRSGAGNQFLNGGERGVVQVSSSGQRCHVQNPQQMEEYGGFGVVTGNPDGSDLAPGSESACPWQNGFYKNPDGPEIYKLYGDAQGPWGRGDKICWVVNMEQLGRLGGNNFKEVERDSLNPQDSLGAARSNTGDCVG